eukprot:XP_001709151.1 Hypothetical protein GL50803_103284 [Giardia lamblia ATCC 50803]
MLGGCADPFMQVFNGLVNHTSSSRQPMCVVGKYYTKKYLQKFNPSEAKSIVRVLRQGYRHVMEIFPKHGGIVVPLHCL